MLDPSVGPYSRRGKHQAPAEHKHPVLRVIGNGLLLFLALVIVMLVVILVFALLASRLLNALMP